MKKSSKSVKDTETDKQSSCRQSYSPPRVLSSEKLEAAAASCLPGNEPYGKPENQQCAIFSS